MAHRRHHIPDLPDELLTNIFLRLDIFELRMMRQASPRYRNLLMDHDFQRDYNNLDPENGARWTFTHGRDQEQPQHNWVQAIREEDGAIMHFEIDLGADLGDADFEMVSVWNTVIFFHLEGHGLRAYNYWNMTSREIETPFPDQMDFFHTRIVQDPHDSRHYTLLCFQEVMLDDGASLYFFARQSQVVQPHFPPDHFALAVEGLTNEEAGSPAFMFIPVGLAGLVDTYFTSLRGEHAVFLTQPTQIEIAGDEPIDGVPHGVFTLLSFTCPEGYFIILGVNRFIINEQMQEEIVGFILGVVSYDGGAAIISAPDVQALIPGGLARYRGYRLQVSQGVIRLSFFAVRAGEEGEELEWVYILEHTIDEAGDIWRFRRLPIDIPDVQGGGGGRYEEVYFARVGIITPF